MRWVTVLGLAVLLVLTVGCSDSQAAVVATTVGQRAASGDRGAPTAPPPSSALTAERRRLTEAARAEIQRAFDGTPRLEMISLINNAERAADQDQQFVGYLGTWQLMRLHYLQDGSKREHKAAMDAVEAVAKTYPQYDPAQFRPEKAKS